MPPFERILLIRMSHLGDVAHAMPVFHALRAAYPAAEIAWAIQPEFAELVCGARGPEPTFLFGRRGGLRAWMRMRAELLSWAPDWTIGWYEQELTRAVLEQL